MPAAACIGPRPGRLLTPGSIPLVGLLAVEFFHQKGGALVVNELAPRPHTTFPTTEVAAREAAATLRYPAIIKPTLPS